MGWIDDDGTLRVDTTSHTSSTDGNSTIQLTDKWKQYVITWTAGGNVSGTKSLIVCR